MKCRILISLQCYSGIFSVTDLSSLIFDSLINKDEDAFFTMCNSELSLCNTVKQLYPIGAQCFNL